MGWDQLEQDLMTVASLAETILVIMQARELGGGLMPALLALVNALETVSARIATQVSA